LAPTKEGRKLWWMLMMLPRIGGAQLGRQDLHVARQHHGVAVHLLEQALTSA
jgi:hypothetical protein